MTVDYFLRPPSQLHNPRHGTGIAVMTVYSILLLLMSATYLRLICTIIINPGYVPRGPQWYEEKEKRVKGKSLDKSREKFGGNNATENGNLRGNSYGSEPPVSGSPKTRFFNADDGSADLHDFFGKDAFVCEGNGKPIWCSYCSNWKPDRAHHCREIGRCVRRMDHFCPWSVHLPYVHAIKLTSLFQHCNFTDVFFPANFEPKDV